MQIKHNPAGEQLISGHHTMTPTTAAYRWAERTGIQWKKKKKVIFSALLGFNSLRLHSEAINSITFRPTQTAGRPAFRKGPGLSLRGERTVIVGGQTVILSEMAVWPTTKKNKWWVSKQGSRPVARLIESIAICLKARVCLWVKVVFARVR